MRKFACCFILFIAPQCFAKAKAACELSIKPDGIGQLKQVGTYEVSNDPSKAPGVLIPVAYKGGPQEGSLQGEIEISPAPVETGWIGIRFRYLDEKTKENQSNTSIIEIPSKLGAKFKTELSFPLGNIHISCRTI